MYIGFSRQNVSSQIVFPCQGYGNICVFYNDRNFPYVLLLYWINSFKSTYFILYNKILYIIFAQYMSTELLIFLVIFI